MKVKQTEKTFSKAFIENATQHSHKVWANKLDYVLESEDVPESIKNVISDVLVTAANEANIGIDAPELIKASFPLIMNRLDSNYRRGIMHSIQSIIEAGLPDSIIDELRQYEKHYVTGKTAREMEAEAAPSLEGLAKQLSEVMNNPVLPTNLYNVIEGELSTNYTNFHSPENVLMNLKSQLEVSQ